MRESLLLYLLSLLQSDLTSGSFCSYNIIQPVPVTGNGPSSSPKPRIPAPYYGAVMANEAIGTGKDTAIAELVVNNVNTAAYGIWEGGRLARAVIINNDVYLPGVNATRTSETVSLLENRASGAGLLPKPWRRSWLHSEIAP